MGVYYYCPYCGTAQLKNALFCNHCRTTTDMIPSKLDSEYYRQKSVQKYGDYTHWKEFLLSEAKENPLFDENKLINPPQPQTKPQPNTPKCPTCNSTNIKKISSLSRAAHGYAFGLFSKTARSQFECKNCGMKF